MKNDDNFFTLPLNAGNDTSEEMPFFASLEKPDMIHEPEGQLAIDVVQTAEEIIVVAPMSGASPDKIELHIHNDVLTVRGERVSPVPLEAEHFYKECYWGKFSRTIVLPVEVKVEMTRAEYRNGVLKITLPKSKVDGNIQIIVVDE